MSIGRDGMRRFVLSLALLAGVLMPGPAVSEAAQPTRWHIVALGDSDTTGEGDASGLGWGATRDSFVKGSGSKWS